MSENNKAVSPSNEEIIDDLTQELRDAQFRTDSPHGITENNGEETTNIPQDFEQSENDSDHHHSESESESENILLEQEKHLTDEQKESRRKEAVDLKNTGNEQYKNGDHSESIETYTQALRICPLKFTSDRAILYANRAASKSKEDNKKGAISDCQKAIKLNDQYVKAYLRRAKLYEETEKLDESLEDYKKVLEIDSGNKDAIIACQRLPPMITERNEKLKEEMFGKLKDLGNLFLRPFGLSTENFQLQQDPNSGGYSVNFSQNPKT